jgi:regulator of replication initiation timing
MNKQQLKDRVLELIREVDEADTAAGELLTHNVYLELAVEGMEEQLADLKLLLQDTVSACSLLALQSVFPELHGRILDAEMYS